MGLLKPSTFKHTWTLPKLLENLGLRKEFERICWYNWVYSKSIYWDPLWSPRDTDVRVRVLSSRVLRYQEQEMNHCNTVSCVLWCLMNSSERKMNSNHSLGGGVVMESLTFKLDFDGIFHVATLVEGHSRSREQREWRPRSLKALGSGLSRSRGDEAVRRVVASLLRTLQAVTHIHSAPSHVSDTFLSTRYFVLHLAVIASLSDPSDYPQTHGTWSRSNVS